MQKAMERNEFQRYLDFFNTKSYDDVVSYFADDCEVHYHCDWTTLPQVKKVVKGKEAFINNYKNMHSNFFETLNLGVFMSTPDTLFVELYTLFEAKKEVEHRGGHFHKGEKLYVNQYIDYDLDENGKFIRIRIAQFNTLDPETA